MSSPTSPSLNLPGSWFYNCVSLANAITAVRLLLTIPFVFLMAGGHDAAFALGVYTLALASDFADGPIARWRHTVTALGGTFDHGVDFLFVTSGMFAGASRGAFPWILPSLIVVAFAQYFIDSYWIHQQGGLRKSNLGRYNGMLYYVALALDIVIRLGARFLEPLLTLLVWVLVASTVASIAQRLAFSFFPEQVPGSSPQK